jgi:hypothetical protein
VQWDRGFNQDIYYELVGFASPYLLTEFTVLSSVEGLTPGAEYKFKYRAQNKYGWGEFSNSQTFQAAAIPLKANTVTTSIENLYVKISWDEPDDQSSEILEYEILIKQKNGDFSEQVGQFCQGSDVAIVNYRYCHVPVQSVLREAPYSLEFTDLVVAKIRARNSIGWANEYSDENTYGAHIQVLPVQMGNPFEGLLTDDTRIQVNWEALTGDDTGGAAILSYNLEMLTNGVA